MLFLFIRKYLIIITIASSFSAGYYLRALQEKAGQVSLITQQIESQNKASITYENLNADINTLYANIDKKVTYEDAYSCAIPVSGLQLLTQATR